MPLAVLAGSDRRGSGTKHTAGGAVPPPATATRRAAGWGGDSVGGGEARCALGQATFHRGSGPWWGSSPEYSPPNGKPWLYIRGIKLGGEHKLWQPLNTVTDQFYTKIW